MNRGIVSVVTGAGKTVLALACIEKRQDLTPVVVVPTVALLDQWWEEAASYFQLDFDEVNIVTTRNRIRLGTINIGVINTVSRLSSDIGAEFFLIVDECHKAASEKFRRVLDLPKAASLGLSATPKRPYDDGLEEFLVPSLGPIIFSYDYRDALRDGVIVPFELENVVFELEPDRQMQYDKLTKSIATAIGEFGTESPEAIRLLLRRTRVLNLSLRRIQLATRISMANRGRRILIFHEDIQACEMIGSLLQQLGVRAGVYHSKLSSREGANMLARYRSGDLEVLACCRALDEGFNVPETELGIIAASTATRRQRIQRLGRILRPAQSKGGAKIYTLLAAAPEIGRLKDEEQDLEGVASIRWSKA